MDKLYSGGYGHTCGAGCSHTFVNATDPFELVNNELFEKALLNIFAERVNVASEIEPNLFNATFGVLDNAIGESFGTVQWGDPNYEFVNELRHNTAVFSAFKTHDQQNEIAKLLVDDKGALKSFAQFKKDSTPIIGKYNNNWLTTEYNTAVIRSRAASQWKEFEADADLYPNLKWLPSTSVETRKSHEPYYNRVWAMNDPFWNGNHPGDLWNCKCGLTNTDEPADGDGIVANYKPAPGLKGNPGKTGELFDDSHPYVADASKIAVKAVDTFLSKNGLIPEKVNEKKFKSGGVIQTPKDFNQTKQEAKKNLKAYTELAKLSGEQYKLLNIGKEVGVKNPDALNLKTNQLSDAKVPNSKNGKNAIQNSIKDASAQKVPEVYIYLTENYPMYDIWLGMKAALQNGRAKSIENIIIRLHDGEIKRYKADDLRTVFNKSKGKPE